MLLLSDMETNYHGQESQNSIQRLLDSS